jgi:hypothetical protein
LTDGRAFGKFFASFWLQNLNTRGLMALAINSCCGSMTNPGRVRTPSAGTEPEHPLSGHGVPGFLNECVASIALPFEDAITSLSERGLKIEPMVVSGRSSSDANAVYIAEGSKT